MAWSFVADRSGNSNKISGGSINHPVPATIAVGEVLVVVTAADNIGTSDITSGGTEHSVSDDAGGNTYTKIIEARRSDGSGADGITVAIFYCVVATQLTTSHTWTFTLSSNRTAKVFNVQQFSTGGDNIASTGGTGAVGNGTTPSVTHNPGSAASRLWVGFVGREGPQSDTETQDSDFTSNPLETVGTTGGTAAQNASGVIGYQIEAAKTTETYAPSLGTSRDWATLLVRLDLASAALLEGTATLAITQTAALTTAIQMAGAVSVVVTTAGDLTTAITMAAAATLVVTTEADLSVALEHLLAGTASCVITTSAALETAIHMAAAADLVVTTAGSLDTAIHMAGAGNVVIVAADADLNTGVAAPDASEWVVLYRRRRGR